MAAKKTTAKKTTAKKAPELDMTVEPAEPRVNYQFTLNVSGLDASEVASLILSGPGGSAREARLKAGPQGTAQWILTTSEQGEHTIEAKAGDKEVKRTIKVGS
jgi:hypothetical protein